ncbi:MAG: DNA replication protein, partial [Oscillospiraceae bacterium]
MKNGMLIKAQKILEQRRVQTDMEQAHRLDEIFVKLPQVIDIRKQLALTSVQLSKLILSKGTDVKVGLEHIKEANLELQKMEKELLVSGGYP